MLTNIISGIGAELDHARVGLRGIDRSWSTTVPRETGRRPLAAGTPVRALRQGEAATMNDRGQVGAFTPHHRFAGFVVGLAQDRETETILHIRGALVLRIQGLTLGTRMGVPIYAVGADAFTLEPDGPVIGVLLAVEDLDRSSALVGIRLATDERPFDEEGQVRERVASA